MKNNKTVAGILLAAGNSTRFGQRKNKNLVKLNNKYVIEYSLEAFEKNPYIDTIFLVTKEKETKEIQSIVDEMAITKKIELVIGGTSRQESVYHALLQTDADIVLIHDGARPLLKQCYLNSCLEELEKVTGCAVAIQSKDTIKTVDVNGYVIQTIPRNTCRLIQTPQAFIREILLECHKKAIENKIEATDDSVLLELNHYPVKIIQGEDSNIKITTYQDLELAREFMKH